MNLRKNCAISVTGRMVSVAPWKVSSGAVPRLRDADGYRIRAAGVCVKGFGSNTEILLVSGGKNLEKWAIPGGGVEKGESHEEAAVRELEEEAGARGEAVECLGVFQDDVKQSRTTVFLMRAMEELAEWQEGQFGRKRRWVPINEGHTYLKNAHLEYLNAIITGQQAK